MRHERINATYVAVLGLLLPAPAFAGPVEEIVQLAIHPSDPQVMVLRYEYAGDGLLYSNDGGRTFKLVCGSSVNDPAVESGPLQKLGPIGVAGDGRVMIGVFGGLYSDDAKGCSWSRASSIGERWITDIVAHPSSPDVTFLITSNGGDIENGIIRRNADGTYTEIGSKKAMLISRLRIVDLPDGGLRFYESGVLGQLVVSDDAGVTITRPNYAIRVSDDEGMTWTEHEMGVVDGTMRLEAVDPTNPDRIVISVSRDRDSVSNMPLADSVLVSSDQGETFEEWTTVTEFGGISFAADGRVWLADSGDTSSSDAPRGVKYAASLEEEAQVLTSDFPANCVHYTGDDLFICQRFVFGRFSIDAGTFSADLELSKLEAMNECEGKDAAAICRQQMCTGYCGTGHFATAPMCKAAYNSNEEIGCAPVGVGGTGGAGGTAGEAGASAGTAGLGGQGGESGTSAQGSDDAGSATDADAEPTSSSASSGCSVATADASSGPFSLNAWVVGVALAWLTRRRSVR